MATIFDFRPGRSIKNVNPQEIGNELERIRSVEGKLTAENVLMAATPEESPMHGAFEWDDAVAAQKHRLDQARRLITSVRVLNSPVGKPVTAFVSVREPDRGRNYVPTVQAMGDEELRLRVLQEVRQLIEGMERRYAAFSEVASVLEKLKKAVA